MSSAKPRYEAGSKRGRWRSISQIYSEKSGPLAVIYHRLKLQGFLEPKQINYSMPSPAADMAKYCSYCHDYGHDIKSCSDTRHAIQQLIDDGKIPVPKAWIPPTISFNDTDLPEVINQNQPLCITLGYACYLISGIWIDSGSAFNVCSKGILNAVGHGNTPLRHSGNILTAYDNIPRKSIGTITLKLGHKSWECDVEFQVIEAPTQFPFLLGRPWLHDTRAIASTLHQKVKIPTPRGIMTIHGDMVVPKVSLISCHMIGSGEGSTSEHAPPRLGNKDDKASLWDLISKSQMYQEAFIDYLKITAIDVTTPAKDLIKMFKLDWQLVMKDLVEKEFLEDRLEHTMICDNKEYRGVLVEGGCPINVCPYKTFVKWGCEREELEPVTFEDLGDEYTSGKAWGKLSTTVDYKGISFTTEFIVLNIPSLYDIKLGQPWMYKIHAILATQSEGSLWSPCPPLFPEDGSQSKVSNKAKVFEVSTITQEVPSIEQEVVNLDLLLSYENMGIEEKTMIPVTLDQLTYLADTYPSYVKAPLGSSVSWIDLRKISRDDPHRNNRLDFTNDDLPPHPYHNHALYITLLHSSGYIDNILVDNGSAINITSRDFLYELGYEANQITHYSGLSFGFDNTPREITGTILLTLKYGPVVYEVNFRVIDCETSYNLLLGRPWLHENQMVASTLH